MSLTIACVWVKGNVDYNVEYVTKLRSMVKRFAPRPHRFVCFTDRPHKLSRSTESIRIDPPGRKFGWWSKLELFNAQHRLTGRVLYLDLDTLVVDSLEAVVNYPAPFALIPHAGEFNGRKGLAVVKRFNSSVMVWDAGTQNHLFDNWTPDVPKRLWGDQDHIGEQSPHAAMMPREWFPRLSAVQFLVGGIMTPQGSKVVLCKVPKNNVAARTLQGFAEAWG